MPVRTTDHLTADQLRAALVDRGLLPPSLRGHLDLCPECRRSVARSDAALQRLALRVRQAAPEPERPFRLPVAAAHRTWRPRLAWRPVYGLATAAAMLLLVSLLVLRPGGMGDGRFQTMMGEIDRLVENALPEAYLHIAGENDLESDEGFLDFLIPPLDDHLSQAEEPVGGSPC